MKCNGYRIELGEVEAAVHSCPLVSRAVVLLRHNALVAYVIVKDISELDKGAGGEGGRVGVLDGKVMEGRVKEHVANVLPAYMLPR